jgi:transposase
VLLAVEGKDASVWQRFAEELGNHNGHPRAVTMVAIDMSRAYAKGVRENFGNAQIVFDKFHVVKAVDEVRRKEARVDAQAREQLERTSWLWRKNPETWTDGEENRWAQLKDKPLVTGLAYAMRLELQRAYAATSLPQARKRFESWSRWVQAEAAELKSGLLEPMRKAADMVERHLEGILAHWQQGLTTAFLEGLNSLFSATKRKARGYRSVEYQTAMLYFVAGKLEIPYYA